VCLGIRLIFYLDDILILGSTFNNCLGNLMKALSLLIEACSLSTGKSSLTPMFNFSFLGTIWDSSEGPLSLPQDKLERLHGQALLLLSCPLPSCRQSWS
jgi:hypothetical protein